MGCLWPECWLSKPSGRQALSTLLLLHPQWMVSVIEGAASSKMTAGVPSARLWFQSGMGRMGKGAGGMVVLLTEPTPKATPYYVRSHLTGHLRLKGTGNMVFQVLFLRKEGRIGSHAQSLPQMQVCSNRTLTIKLPWVQLTSLYLQNWGKTPAFWTATQGMCLSS